MEFRELLQVLWRRRWLVALVVVATTALSAAFAFTRPTEYESVSTVALTPTPGNAGFVTPETLNALLGTYSQTAQSSLMLKRASQELGREIEGSIETATQSGTGILQIIATAESPEGAAASSNAVSKAFISYLSDSKLFEPEIVDPATVPSSAVAPRPPLIIAIGILLGLIAGVMLAYAVEQFRGRIETASDIAAITPLPIIGVLPRQRRLARSPSRLIWDDLELTPLHEAVRALRTNIELLVENRQALIQVTSALASEGKSTIVANLGVALAKVGIETLIVDADLRRPTQHEIFRLNNDRGVSSLLTGKVGGKMRRSPTEFQNLTVLPSGPLPPNSTEALHVRAASLVEELRATNALVLIDSPPLLPVSDARILSSRVDGVVLTVAAGSEKPSVLRNAIEILQFSGASILGVALNQAIDEVASAGYHRQYHAATQSAQNDPINAPALR